MPASLPAHLPDLFYLLERMDNWIGGSMVSTSTSPTLEHRHSGLPVCFRTSSVSRHLSAYASSSTFTYLNALSPEARPMPFPVSTTPAT